MIRKYWIALCVFLSLGMVPALSNATCTITGVIVRVTSYDDSYSNTGGYIYFRTSSLGSYTYYVYSNDDDMVSNAIAYMNSGRAATIQGNIQTCPAVPAAGGSTSLGQLNYIYNPY